MPSDEPPRNLELRRDRRERLTLILSTVLAVVTIMGVAPGIWLTFTQVQSLNQGRKLADTEAKETQQKINRGQAHLSVRWISVDPTFTGVTPVQMFAKALGQKKASIQVTSAQTSGASLYSRPLDLPTFVRSNRCKCPALQDGITKSEELAGSGHWTFLAITNDSEVVAQDVVLAGKRFAAGKISFWDITDIYPVYGGDASGLVEGSAAERHAFKRAPTSSLRLGPLSPGETVLVSLFLAAGTFEKKSGRLLGVVTVSQTLIPTKLSFRSQALRKRSTSNVRTPSKNPLFLTSAIQVRG